MSVYIRFCGYTAASMPYSNVVPGSPLIRFNTTTKNVEVYDGSDFVPLGRRRQAVVFGVSEATPDIGITELPVQHDGMELSESAPGIAVDRACITTGAVISWRADSAPAGKWTLTLKKKGFGDRAYTTAATIQFKVNDDG
jgi:hypothetical protein